MNCNSIKAFVFILFIFSTTVTAGIKSFAEEDNASDEQTVENSQQEISNQIHDLELRIQKTDKRLDDLDRVMDANAVTQVAPVQVEAVQETPVVGVVPSQESAPVAIKAKPVPVSPPASNNNVLVKNSFKESQFTLASEFSYMLYREPGLMREHGPYFGAFADYYYRPLYARDWLINVLNLDAHVNVGDVNYKSTFEATNIDDYMFEPRLWFGHDIDVEPSVDVTPYVGIGYRYLFDGLSKAMNGYDRLSQYLYVPLGFETAFQMPDNWQIGFNGEYDIFMRGWQTSYLSDINSSYPNLDNTQRGGFGLRGSLDIIKKMDKVNLLISPYIRYWRIKQSNTAVVIKDSNEIIGYEPNNNSTEVGANLGVQF